MLKYLIATCGIRTHELDKGADSHHIVEQTKVQSSLHKNANFVYHGRPRQACAIDQTLCMRSAKARESLCIYAGSASAFAARQCDNYPNRINWAMLIIS